MEFDKKKLKRMRGVNKAIQVNVRITKGLSCWLKEKDYSPTAVLEQACKMLGYEEKTQAKVDTKKQ